MRGRRVGCWIFSLPRKLFALRAPATSGKTGVAETLVLRTWYLFRLVQARGDLALMVEPLTRCAVADIRGDVGMPTRCFFCAWGAPYHRGVALRGANLPVDVLAAECPGCQGADQGTALESGPAGRQLQGVIDRWWPAAGLSLLRAVETGFAQRAPVESSQPSKGFQTPWSNSLSRSASWDILDQWTWTKGGHINILEAGAERRLFRWLSRQNLHGRFNLFEDCRVTLLGGAKGRTSSRALRGQM